MCGIFATTRPDLWISRLPDIQAALNHRGPDGQGVWADKEAGVLMVHSRLSIVGLGTAGDQPQTVQSSTLVYNGEIYNHAAIARRLGMPVPACDTHTLHSALRKRGTEALSLLDGMFALAWWDKTEGRLLIARDVWGIKPIYLWQHSGGGVTAASELSVMALLRPDVDPTGLAQYVCFGYGTASSTVYRQVTKLPPGAYLEMVKEGGGWRTSNGRIATAGTETTDLGRVLRQSISEQLMADVPVGVFLSGGLDSTIVAALAATEGAEPHCFTLGFPESPDIDESGRAARNAQRLKLAHTVVPATAKDMASRARPLIESAGEPIGDPAALAIDLLSETAAGYVKVVLTGEGADELFGGYVRHRVSRTLASGRLWAVAPLLRPVSRVCQRIRSDRPWHRAAAATLVGGGAVGYATLQQAELSVLDTRPDLLRSITAELRTDWDLATQIAGRKRAAIAFDQLRWLPNTYLEKIDRATMRHSLEGRVPFLGNAMTSWASASLPTGKEALCDTLSQVMPDAELPDRKKGLAIDIARLMHFGLAESLERVLNGKNSVLRTAFGDSAMDAIKGRSERSALFAYRLATVGLWQEAHNL